MKELFSLGNLYVSDFIDEGQLPRGPKVEMKMVFDTNTKEVRLDKVTEANVMYGKYWYRSGINQTMRTELQSIVTSIQNVIKINSQDIWIDIACNDGTLLGYVPEDIIRIGIDPAEDSFKQEAEKNANIIIQDYFSKKVLTEKFNWDDDTHSAKVVTCIAMFYDLDDPDPFLKDVYDILDTNGLFVLQLSYTPLMLEQLAFDNICHEHIFYYTLYTLKNRLEKNGFQVVDCQLNDVNGGSFRIYVMKKEADKSTFATQPHRDVCSYRVNSILALEEAKKYNEPEIWNNFYHRLLNLKKEVTEFIIQAKKEGKSIWGYGASTKGNTLLQYFDLNNNLIEGIAERSPYKYGLKTVGTNIPIYSEADMRKVKPDYLLVLPWHFINEFCEREKDFLNSGGTFIVPCPKFELI